MYVAAVVPMVMVWFCAPPSDHEANVALPCGLDACRRCWEFTMVVMDTGVVTVVSL